VGQAPYSFWKIFLLVIAILFGIGLIALVAAAA
jgi:hypothetical protein